MKLRHLFFCVCLLLGKIDSYTQKNKQQLSTVGLFAFHPAQERHYKFWKACGYNTIQFIDIAISLPKEERKDFYVRIRKGIDDAKKAGLKVGIIIQSNILPYPKNWWDTYDLDNQDSISERLSDITIGARALNNADFFSFFGGDPGGSTRVYGPAGIDRWMEMSRKVQAIVKKEAPRAFYNANMWAITHWDYIQISPYTANFWEKEVAYGKKVIADKTFINADCGVEFPVHNYYRSLAYKAYADENKQPELFPIASDVNQLRKNGVKRMWGWAHFIIDEVDDGYTGYSGKKGHPSQAETRSIHHLINGVRDAGLNGIFSFVDGPGSEIETMNVYAFGRFCTDPSLTPEKAIDDFSAILADKQSWQTLAQVIRFIDNNSTWEASIPALYQQKKFDCKLKDATQALHAMETVKANPNPSFPLPDDAVNYFNKLKSRLEDIQAADSSARSELMKVQQQRLAQDWACLKCFEEENKSLQHTSASGRVVFMGNSITAGWKKFNPALFNNGTYINRGIPGQTTSQMLIRFRQDVVNLNPEAVLILAGTNDLAGIGGAVSVDAVFGNIVSMAEIAKASGITAILSSVLPVYDYLCCPGMEPIEKIKRLNGLLKEYANRNQLVYVDYYSKMVDDVGGMQSPLSEDGLHPNGKGYEIMTKLAEQAIKQVIR